jgi:hypothetical protein
MTTGSRDDHGGLNFIFGSDAAVARIRVRGGDRSARAVEVDALDRGLHDVEGGIGVGHRHVAAQGEHVCEVQRFAAGDQGFGTCHGANTLTQTRASHQTGMRSRRS